MAARLQAVYEFRPPDASRPSRKAQLAGASYASVRWSRAGLILATVCLFLNWLGDSLDLHAGACAPASCVHDKDSMSITSSIPWVRFSSWAGLAMSGLVQPRIAAVKCSSPNLVLSAEVYLATHTMGKLKLSFGKFGPTDSAFCWPRGTRHCLCVIDVPILGNTFQLFNLAGSIGHHRHGSDADCFDVRNGWQLYREETLPKEIAKTNRA